MSDQNWFSKLADTPGPLAHLPNNGAAYHSGEQIVTHLNRVLGPQNWSFHVLELGEESDSDECYCFGQITALIDGVTVVKQDYGSQAFKRARSTGKYLSKWDDKKGAATDALKRCARLLGVGLDAWANERAPSWQPEPVDDAPPAPTPVASDPTPLKTKAELALDVHRGLEYARSLGLEPADVDCGRLDRAEIESVLNALRAMCREAVRVAKASS